MDIEKELEEIKSINFFAKKSKKKKPEAIEIIEEREFEPETEDLEVILEKIQKAMKKKDKKIEFASDMLDEGNSRKRHKELVKKYESMFKNEKALMTALLKESDKDTKVIRDAFMSLVSNGTVRGVMGKVATDFASALIASNSHRLAIIKQLSDITKTANDLAFKEESRSSSNGENAMDSETLGTLALRSLFNQSSKDFNNEISSSNAISEAEFARLQDDVKFNRENFDLSSPLDDTGNTKEQETVQREPVKFDMEEQFQDLSDKYKDDPIYGRSASGDSMIANESRGVKVKVRRWSNEVTGKYEFDFVAMDKDGEIVEDYEVPDKSRVRMSWNEETGTAKDNRGRIYEIINL